MKNNQYNPTKVLQDQLNLAFVCPYCGAERAVPPNGGYALLFDAWEWSDGKFDCLGMPEVSEIQQCPDCKRFYHVPSVSHHEVDRELPTGQIIMELTLEQLLAVKKQMDCEKDSPKISERFRKTFLKEFFIAYNSRYKRAETKGMEAPSEEHARIYNEVIEKLLEQTTQELNNNINDECVTDSEGNARTIKKDLEAIVFKAELLRESGRMEEARETLLNCSPEENHTYGLYEREYRSTIDKMLRRIDQGDTNPILLMKEGEKVDDKYEED